MYLAPCSSGKNMPKFHTTWYEMDNCQKVNFISYHKIGVSYLHVLFHTYKCHFIPHRYYFIPTHVISYLQQPVSYEDIVSYLRKNFVCLQCFIPKHVISSPLTTCFTLECTFCTEGLAIFRLGGALGVAL